MQLVEVRFATQLTVVIRCIARSSKNSSSIAGIHQTARSDRSQLIEVIIIQLTLIIHHTITYRLHWSSVKRLEVLTRRAAARNQWIVQHEQTARNLHLPNSLQCFTMQLTEVIRRTLLEIMMHHSPYIP